MELRHDGIRKVAILVASLDQAGADAVLEHLDPESAQQVRRLMVEMDRIDPQEQRRVIDEFFRTGHMVPEQCPPGIELDDRLARALSVPPARAAADEPPVAASPDSRPFRFLHETEGEKLARALADERPQTIALVLSHLPPDRAGNVLARLRPDQQTDVIHRLIDLEETDPVILREVERALESRLSQQVRMQRRRVAGLAAVTGILEASDRRTGMQILGNVAARDQLLAERLGLPAVEFDDLDRLDDASLAAVFRAAESEWLMTALIGAPPVLIDRILRGLPQPEAEDVRRRLDYPGPLRLSDVETARKQMADLACRLAAEGRIRLPRKETLLVA